MKEILNRPDGLYHIVNIKEVWNRPDGLYHEVV